MSARTLKRENALLRTINRMLIVVLNTVAASLRAMAVSVSNGTPLKPLTLQDLRPDGLKELGELHLTDPRFDEQLKHINRKLDVFEAKPNPSAVAVNRCVKSDDDWDYDNVPVDEEVAQ